MIKTGVYERKHDTIALADLHYIDGVLKEYYESGKIKKFIEYQEGVKNGVEFEFFENGKSKTKGFWKNDSKDGVWIKYGEWRNSTTEYETFKNGKKLK